MLVATTSQGSEDSRGLRHIINWTRTNYGDWDILITENGFSNGNRSLEDSGRINYLESYLEQVSLVIHEDHHNVLGYSVWALMDTFEWKSGYTSKFGLYDIDFNDPNQRETMRSSGVYYACIIKHRNLNDCASLLTPVIKD
ncbi:unnamed protein product [Leptosia nina]|uniref:beta-glucosidase n=1 Tax=Leptosia nina TaxID=320188 RepID=A0AAV1JFH8_9NEOP